MIARTVSRMLRLGKTQPKKDREPLRRIDPQTLIREQSVAGAIAGAVGAVIILSGCWTFFTAVSGRVFPWFSIVQGLFVGLAVRRLGRGLDWRYPLIAGSVAWLGAFFGNLLVAIPVTTSELDASVYQVVRGLTWWSFTTFFHEVITVVDYIYAFCAATVAMFCSKRRLNRHEEFALRTRQEP